MARFAVTHWNVVLAASLMCGVVHAAGPSYKTDGELVRYPVIVVAQWDRAEIRKSESDQESHGSRFQVETEINVLQVIKGRIRPGKHRLLLGWVLPSRMIQAPSPCSVLPSAGESLPAKRRLPG